MIVSISMSCIWLYLKGICYNIHEDNFFGISQEVKTREHSCDRPSTCASARVPIAWQKV